MAALTWLCEQRERDELIFRVGRDGESLVADFVGVGRLSARPGDPAPTFEPYPDASPAAVAKLLEGPVPALLRTLEGRLALHGASAARNGRAIVCVGPSGAGKSTTIAELARRAGVELVSDDAAALDAVEGRIQITPTEPTSWLLPAARRALGLDASSEFKTRVAPRARCTGRPDVIAICGLTFDDSAEPSLRRLAGAEAFAVLAGCAVRFDIDDPTARVRELEQLMEVCRRVSIFELRRPRALEKLSALGDLLEALLTAGGNP